MKQSEIDRIIKRLSEKRVSDKKKYTKMIGNFDFASLYPSTITINVGGIKSIRKRKINKIFNLEP